VGREKLMILTVHLCAPDLQRWAEMSFEAAEMMCNSSDLSAFAGGDNRALKDVLSKNF
jgi:hypothetical protein